MTQAALAKALGISAMRISHLVREERPVAAELALRLGPAFGQSPQYWLNLQADYDLRLAPLALKDSLKAVRTLAGAPNICIELRSPLKHKKIEGQKYDRPLLCDPASVPLVGDAVTGLLM